MKMKGRNKANLVDLVLCIIIFENHDFKVNITAETNTWTDYFLFLMLCFYFLICFLVLKSLEEMCYMHFGLFNLRADAKNSILDYSVFFSRTLICFDVS